MKTALDALPRWFSLAAPTIGCRLGQAEKADTIVTPPVGAPNSGSVRSQAGTLGLPPSYEQKAFPIEERRRQLRRLAAPVGRDSTVTVHHDALFVANLEPCEPWCTKLSAAEVYGCKLA